MSRVFEILNAVRGRVRVRYRKIDRRVRSTCGRPLRRRAEARVRTMGASAAAMNIPIVINNRNRVTYLKMMIEALESRGARRIIIIDNASTYRPLLSYYEQLSYRVVRCRRNIGPWALWQTRLYKELRDGFFVYSDSDIVPDDSCPADFLERWLEYLGTNADVSRVGFGLRIDDLPEAFAKRDSVVAWERRYWEEEREPGYYVAPIDTTFALYRPWMRWWDRTVTVRTGGSMVARHMPWYIDSSAVTEEEQFYIDNCAPGMSWWAGADNHALAKLKELGLVNKPQVCEP